MNAAITSYFLENYPADTLVKAFRNKDSSIVVLSKNNGAFANLFSSTGVFIERVQIGSKAGMCLSIDISVLPASVINYLSLTYPNYVFEKAFSIIQNGTVKAYVVIIDANNTKYGLEFGGAGNFVSATTIR